jgi:hypothetical protein
MSAMNDRPQYVSASVMQQISQTYFNDPSPFMTAFHIAICGSALMFLVSIAILIWESTRAT